jgi:hypothetical protein
VWCVKMEQQIETLWQVFPFSAFREHWNFIFTFCSGKQQINEQPISSFQSDFHLIPQSLQVPPSTYTHTFKLDFFSCSLTHFWVVASPYCVLQHTTLGRISLDKWTAQCRDFYLITQNVHTRQTSIPLVGFEPTLPASKWPQIHASDPAATEINLWERKESNMHAR